MPDRTGAFSLIRFGNCLDEDQIGAVRPPTSCEFIVPVSTCALKKNNSILVQKPTFVCSRLTELSKARIIPKGILDLAKSRQLRAE